MCLSTNIDHGHAQHVHACKLRAYVALGLARLDLVYEECGMLGCVGRGAWRAGLVAKALKRLALRP